MNRHGIYISPVHDGMVFVAERSRRGSGRFLWSTLPVAPTAGDSRINARQVPRAVRRAAYRHLAKQGGV
jgi:hypothetical protein